MRQVVYHPRWRNVQTSVDADGTIHVCISRYEDIRRIDYFDAMHGAVTYKFVQRIEDEFGPSGADDWHRLIGTADKMGTVLNRRKSIKGDCDE